MNDCNGAHLETVIDSDQDGEGSASAADAHAVGECLVHASPRYRMVLLTAWSEHGAVLDLSGAKVDASFIDALLDMATVDDRGRPKVRDVMLAGTVFEGRIDFRRAVFSEKCDFAKAVFEDDVQFSEVVFLNAASFRQVTFQGGADFKGATFCAAAFFTGVTFHSYGAFQRVSFNGQSDFSGTLFHGHAGFSEVSFEGRVDLGPLLACTTATLYGARFAARPSIMVAARELDCRRLLLLAGADRFQAHCPSIDLQDADLSQDVVVAALPRAALELVEVLARPSPHAHQPQEHRPRAGAAERDWLWRSDGAPAWLREPSAEDAQTAGVAAITSLRGVDVTGVTVADADLSACMLTGVRNLDRLRLDGQVRFAQPPPGWQRAGWRVWRYTQRSLLAEEHRWRADAARGWRRQGWPEERIDPVADRYPFGEAPEPAGGPARLAGVYRALRQARESAGDAPGAADFYYGEMEMRRHTPVTTWNQRVERWLLTAYWLVSGYGLRAWRAALALLIVLLLAAVVFTLPVAVITPPRALAFPDALGFAAAVTFAVDFAVHINATAGAGSSSDSIQLTLWGHWTRILLRIAGPVLISLIVLSLRGRVRR